MFGRVVRGAALAAIACGSMWGREVAAQYCVGPNFAYGNAGYGAGSSIAGVGCRRWGTGYWSGGGVCGPWWRGGCHVGGWPTCGRGGYWLGWPGLGFGGCYGASRWGGCESVYLSVPPCGGATFFSGRQVPFVTGVVPFVGGWPTNWYPGYAVGPWGWYPSAVPAPVGVGPQFGPAGILPFLGAGTSGGAANAGLAAARPATVRQVAAARAAPAPRLVNDAARRRAARLVAVGDRHLRAARVGVPVRVRQALDAYRRAATAAPDDPDIRVREALTLVALGDANGADAALARATAIDGRLSAAPPRRGDAPPDPVFGDRVADAPTPLAARGTAILREIGGADAGDVEWLAARWGDRWAGATVARR
ncbi:MAG: hypothetical protein ACKOSQ_02005 [Planctomycetaceae bacterium]